MNNKGIALLTTYLVIAVMLVSFSAMQWRSINESRANQRFVQGVQVFWVAEAGIQKAARALNDGTGTGDSYSIAENLASGSYIATVICATCTNPRVTSVGSVAGSDVTRTLTATFQTQSILTRALFTQGAITMSGNGSTDSYDSSKGAYGAGNKGSDGDIGTNGATSGIISLSGNTKVNGDATTGEGGSVTKSGNASVTGTITEASSQNIPAVVVPSCLTDLSSSGAYSLSGNTSRTLTTGNYRYTSLSIFGNGKLTVTGAVKIYLTGSSSLGISGNGKISISGGGNLMIYTDGTSSISGNGIANTTNVPSNFILKSTYSGASGISLTGNADLQGVIYAPTTGVTNSGNGSVYGAVIGNTASITGNGNIHYDKALVSLAGFGTYSQNNWADENNPYPR